MSSYWSNEELKEIVKKSKTITEVLAYFGLPKNQGYYNRMFHKSIKELNIDISHLIENAKEQTFRQKIPLEELLIKGVFRNTKDIKRRLLKEKLLINNCYMCGMKPFWNGKELKLHLDHISGDNTDNRIENLRLLCPNCHSQTDTYCGAKAKKEKHAHKYVCKTCGGPKKNPKSKVCPNCIEHKTKIEWPNPMVVLSMVKENGFVGTSKKLNVSDNSIRKFLKKHGLIEWSPVI